jgi:YhhN family
MFVVLDPTQRVWLISLLVLWAALLFGGFMLGSAGQENRRMPRWTRLCSSAVLVLAAWSWFYFTRTGPVALFGLLVALGMTFGFAGDLFLAGVLLRSGGKLAGIGAFALGHICYILAIIWLGGILALNDRRLTAAALILWWFIAVAGWYFIVYRGAGAGRMKWIVLPYALLLATTAGLACGLALQDAAFWPLLLGAALFLLSDTILGGEWFSDLRLPLIHDVIWLTYGPGQMLIVYSIGIANAAAS